MSLFLHPIDLPRLHLEGNLFLAPMAGYSDTAFREVCLRAFVNVTEYYV